MVRAEKEEHRFFALPQLIREYPALQEFRKQYQQDKALAYELEDPHGMANFFCELFFAEKWQPRQEEYFAIARRLADDLANLNKQYGG